MSQEEYDKKLRSVHRFIPFLENIITQLKDPKMKNREQQLSKMESLYQMIMDKNKKLKLETLNKCEDVIIKLFYKVRGKNAILPPIYNINTTNKQGDKRKSIDLYSLAGETINKQDTFNEFYGGSSSGNFKSTRKPPISYSDLECLEKDVAHELEKKMSLQELNTLRYRLCRELEESKPDEINTTVRNKPVPTKLNTTSPDKNRKKVEMTMNVQLKNEPSVTKKIDSKPTAPKVLKEAGDLFGNAFSEIDKSYGLGLKKKDDSKYIKEKKDVEMENEKASLKQLSEKAAQLRRNVKPIENENAEKTTNETKYPLESTNGTPLRENDSDNVPLRNPNTRNNDVKDKEKSISAKVSKIDYPKEKPKKEKNQIDDFKEKNKKEKNEIDEFKEKNERGKCEKDSFKEKNKKEPDVVENSKEKNKKEPDVVQNSKEKNKSTDSNVIPLKNPNNKAADPLENKEKSKSSTDVSNIINNGDCKDQMKTTINQTGSEAAIVPLENTMSENVIPKNESNKVINKLVTDNDKDLENFFKADEHRDKNRMEKEKSRNETEKTTPKNSEDKYNKSKSKSSKCPNDKEKKRSDHKEKQERSHKSDHKKDKEEKHKDKNRERSHKEHDKDKDRKDRSKDKDNKEKKSKSAEIKDGSAEKKAADKNKDSKTDKKEKQMKESEQDIAKNAESKQKDVISIQDIPNKITFESENANNEKNYQDDYEQLTQKLNEIIESTAKTNERSEIETKSQISEKPLVEVKAETKAINRDPRLKQGSAQNLSTDRIAFKYNPKPKRQEADADLEKNVVDSIEKSMKESNVPMPPALKLTAPPAPPTDLFSPESPDEIDKMAVPPILNDLLLNPKTTGMLNEVVSALRRSNNDSNLISISTSANVCSGESNQVGQTFNQTPALRFSPPVPKIHFEAPPVEVQIFSPPKQTRCFTPFSDQKEFDYPPKRNQGPPSHLNSYEERIGQGYFAERTGCYAAPSLNYSSPTLNYIPPSPSYVASVSSFVPPSPNYVPPSPIYEGNAETFRDINYQNFQGSNSQRFFDGDRGSIRSKGLLGDAPSRLPFKNPYQKNYDSFSSFGLRGSSSNLAETRPNYYGGSRDPRINMNRGLQYAGQDIRPVARESRMTYREYKEQKEREKREREMREREMKEKEELDRKQKERDEIETNANSIKERENVSNSQVESENDKDRTSIKVEEKESDRSRTRDRSRDRYSRNRSSSRYRKDRDDYRNRGDRRDRNERRDRSRERSKFDKAYSVREKDKSLASPLNELFNPKSTSGKGYSIQYKIPKKVKDAEQSKEDNVKNNDTAKIEKGSVKKRKNDEKFQQDAKLPSENVSESKNAEADDIPEKQIKVQEVETKQETVSDQNMNKNTQEEAKQENDEKTTESKLDTEQQTDSKDDKKCNIGEKKEEEENILSKFFQNLMKSGNKDEKKGALLSLISTFSDSFSDQQMQKITSIIKSEDNNDEPDKKETKPEKQDIPSNQLIELKVDDKTEIIPQGDTQKPTEEEIEQGKEEPADGPIEAEELPEKTQTKIKSEILKPELKSKMKTKSELDRLHDDIREMFIRDGVVTATGKRMCRILKDNSPQKSSTQEKLEEEAPPEETEKKITTPKRRGRKPGYRKNKETPEVEMKELTVILPKMSLDKIKTADEVSEKEKHSEGDDKADKKEENSSEEEASDKEPAEKTSPIRRGRYKKRNSWATGVIKRKPCPKSKKVKVQDVAEEKKSVKEAETELDIEMNSEERMDIRKEGLHEIDYYLKIGQTRLQCKYCEVSTKWIAAHYRTEHPNEEVISSRLAPNVAKAAIADAIKNREIYENDKEESMSKHEFLCSFCDYKQITLPKFYRDHVSIHTGEFRHTCPYCSFSRSHIKTMQTHVMEVHAEEEATSRKPLISERAPNNRNVYAYICDMCNFTQMNLDNVKRHVKNYHSQVDKCQIHKIKVNCIEKIEEKTADDNAVLSERSTRRLLKSNRQPEEITASPSQEFTKPLNIEVPPKEEEEAKIMEDESLGSCDTSNTEEESNETDKPRNLQTSPRRTRKRGKMFKTPPSPVKKRLKRRCTLNRLSSTDFDDDKFEEIEEKTTKNIDEAVFTSNTDIQEENKRIEEERLKTMQDINSTIKLRTSSDFVEKLSHKLKQEEEVIVKQEVEEIVENILETPVKDLPVFEKSGIQIREAEQVSIRQESSPKVGKDSGKVNPINGVIEKLQGILGNPPTSCDNVASPNIPSEELSLPPIEPTFDDNPPSLEIAETKIFPKDCVGNEAILPPPLIHMNNVEQTVEKSNIVNSEILNIGYVKVIKTMSTYIYVCCLPPCIFSSRDRTVFARHCQYNHQWDENSPKTSQCLECGETFACSEGGNLLTSALDHTNSHHSNFLGIKIGSIRISTNLFPESRGFSERPSTPPTISIPSPPGSQHGDDIDCFFSNNEPPAETNEGENPFSFKIVDVVSLAEENTSDKVVEPQSPDKEPGPSQIQQDSSPSSKMQSINLLMSKCKSKQEEALSRKWPAAMKKFLSNYFDLYKCPDYLCVFTTNKRKMFDIHLRTHPNNKKKVNCLYCDKLIDFETSGDHYEKLHGMCRFSCSYCLYRCIAKDYMDIHQVLAHPDMQSRMQLLPKRDSEDKSSISILSEATKLSPITPYLCCDKEYLHQIPFIEHVEKCMKNTNFRCYYGKGMSSCQIPHNNSKDLVNHWGTTHDVYPLKCAYCSVGDFDLNVMMIHLVLEHPTLPPDIIDRYNTPVSRNKKTPTISSVQCNFKELVFKLKSYSNCLVPKTAESLHLPVTSPTVSPPKTMQTAFENFVQMSNSKTISTFPKVTPLSITPSIALLKPTSKANVINAGSVVYCLSPASNSQKSLLKAIVVNKDKTMGPQKLQLVAPMSSKTDGKYQIVNKIMPMAPPKLAPLTTIQNISSMNKVITSSSDIITLNSPDANNHVSVRTQMEDRLCDIQKDGNIAGDLADMENLEEPMVVIDDDLDNERDEAVDPLSLDIEDSSTGQLSKTPQANAPPIHDYDSDSKDLDQHEMLVQKSGLVGYQLYRCAKCDMFFPGSWQFKEHLINSTQCRFENSPQKPYKCFHCGKYLKHYTNLLDHLAYHGPPRFTCSLCNNKFPHANQVKYHMKTQHNVVNVQMQPLIQTKANLNNDSFIAKPLVIGSIKPTIKETNSEIEAHKATEVKTVYYSFEADQIPQKSILGYDITCGHCKKFKNKVRSNIVRHLLLHQNDKDFTVPDTAPVNPVPCLEKNEKMFDKMCNLASSSHTGGRMGGQQKGESSKDKAKDNNYPAFVPSNKRYQCCAVGCNYLCLEEGNLRHHLTALHMEDLNFVCVHCKRDLSDAVDVDTIIKHLKLHDLHLYKCSYCDYMHNLKHKIERHIGDDHKNKEGTVVTIRAMDAEPYDENQQQPFIPVTVNQKSQKPWKCCMCKYKCQMEEEVMNHVKNKHNIDCRYKCALCTFKTNGVSEFKEHFKTNHPEGAIDIISVYHKVDENSEQVPENDQFDTTPLWLRDKPRVRHIRGILFEDDTAMKKKATPVKTDQLKELSGTSTTKKRKRSMSTVNEPFKLEDESIQPKKEPIDPKIGNIPFDRDIIVIEDDEVEEPLKTDNKKIDPVENQDLNDVELICRFGDFGMPLNKHFKCPKCEKYKTTKMRDFIQHVAGELRYYRFLCKICQEKFITLENIQMHCIDYHDCSVKSVTHMPVDEAINKWLTLLLIEQRKIMVNLGLACDEVPTHIEDFLGRMEVLPKKSIKCKECGFTVSGSQALDRHMKYNHPHLAFTQKSQPPKPSEPAQQTSTSGKKRLSVTSLEGVTQPKKIKMAKTIPMVKDKYVCNDCGIEFNSVPEMEYHSKENHNGVVGYTIKKTNLPINSGVLRIIYRCRYCPTTGTKSYLEVHISNDHPGQKIDLYRFSCGFCSAKFENLKSFRQHFKSHDLPEMFYFDVYDRKVALQQSSISTTSKMKTYKCPKCSYKSKSSNPNNIKLHITLHAKAFQCGICQGLFKTKRQARTHHLNEHPHNKEVITTRQDMFKLADQLLKEAIDTATIEERDNTITDDSIEESIESTIQSEVLKSNDDEFVDIETIENDKSDEKGLSRLVHKEKKHFAKKSTGLNIKSDETKEYYSFYGQKAEPVDLKKITTDFEIGGSRVKISCEQLTRICNLNPILQVNDCMTLIIDDDEALTS